MRVFITGGSGSIGRNLVRRLAERGDEPVILSRRSDELRRDTSMRGLQVVQGDPSAPGPWQAAVDGCDAVVNLAGHNIFAGRWNSQVKRLIRDSRVYSTENVVGAIAKARHAPTVLVNGSAIGYYGPHGDEELTEQSPSGADFMAVVCREWEEAAIAAESLGVRVARVRTGIVLARDEGALGVMTPIFKWLPFGASAIGSDGSFLKPGLGHQWMSWIHLEDITGIFLMAIDRSGASGPINGTSPNPVRNADFSRALARALHRPFIPFGPPDPVLQLVLGDVSKVITRGQKVLPVRTSSLGYHFQFPELHRALENLFARRPRVSEPKPAPASAGSHHH